MRRLMGAGLALLALLISLPIPASEVMVQEIPLEEVVESALLIAVVKPATPPTDSRSVPVVEKGETYEAFAYSVDRLEVLEVIHDPGSHTKVGATLEVAPGDLGEMYGGHVEYVVRDTMESPIVESYTSSLPGGALPDRFVVFLRYGTFHDEPITAYVVVGARESVEQLPAIKTLLGRGEAPPEEPTEATPPK